MRPPALAGRSFGVDTTRGRVLVTEPDGSSAAVLSVDLAATFSRAAHERAAACLLRPRPLADAALFSLVPSGDVERVEPRGLRGARWRMRWRLDAARNRASHRLKGSAASFWIETYRELRRHVGDDRLPYPLRTRLREAAQGAFGRSREAERRTGADRFPRRLLQRRIPVDLPPELMASARDGLRRLGLDPGRPIVAIEAPSHVERFGDAIDLLVADGYQVVRIGEAQEPIYRNEVLDLASVGERAPSLDVFVLLTARVLICSSVAVQHVAYLTNTPCLTLDVADPIAGYPVRDDGLYLLATAVDLESGARLGISGLVTARYLRNVKRFGRRRNGRSEIALAARELIDGLAHGASGETESQKQYREIVLDASRALRGSVPSVAAWGDDDGFIGDGRLARVQADRWL